MQFQQASPIALPNPTGTFIPSISLPYPHTPSSLSKKPDTVDTYAQNQTHFQFPWPREINGIERVVLSAKGDLQRVLSAYFGSPITVAPQFKTSSLPPPSKASHASPIIQDRRVHLMCASRLVCIATSTVTLFEPSAASLILDEKYAIGQAYRVLGENPEFELLSVSLDYGVDGKERVTRRYRLKTRPMECDITEVFIDRAMFREEQWLYRID